MKNLKALLERQAQLKQRMNALLDLAAKENREFADAEEHEYTQLEADMASVETDIAVAKKNADRRRAASFDAPGAVVPGLPGGRRIQVGDDRATLDPKSGFASIAEFAQAVRRASSGPQS